MSKATVVASSHGSLQAYACKGRSISLPRSSSPDPIHPNESINLRERARTGVSNPFTHQRSAAAESTYSKDERSGNELLIFVGLIVGFYLLATLKSSKTIQRLQAILTSLLNAVLLSFAYGIFEGNASRSSTAITESNSAASMSAIEQVILICFYLAMLLCLCAGAFAWMMHNDVLKHVWKALGKQDIDTSHLSAAVKSGSLFWVVSFILPSVLLTSVGLQVLVWSQDTIAIGVSMSLGMCLCIWQLYRVLRNIGEAAAKEKCGDKEEKLSRDNSRNV